MFGLVSGFAVAVTATEKVAEIAAVVTTVAGAVTAATAAVKSVMDLAQKPVKDSKSL
ncbi:MAG: hypothetical protein ACI4I3_03310 [Acutalibacteraceae bacterium]